MPLKFESIFTNQIARDINGVINTDSQSTLGEEFSEYVITNEVANCLDGFFEKYNEHNPIYNGVWISGFFGCGKSHLLKILSYLIANSDIDGKKAVSYFDNKLNDNPMLLGQMRKAAGIPSESILFNIVQYNQNDKSEPILHIFQRKFYEHCGYYGINPKIAAFEMELDKEGLFEKFKEVFNQVSGKVWEEARKKPNINNRHIIKAFAEVTGNAEDPDLLDSYEAEISIHDFAVQVKEYMDSKGSDFRLNFFVDEVGQFVARSSRLMVDLQEIATSLSSVTGNRSWVMVTSQDELEKFVKNLDKQDKTDISKIMGRFYVKMSLSNANVNEVIQKRLLEKNEEGKKIVGSAYEIQKENFNTLFQFVNGPKKYRVYRDKDEFVTTYPFVTYQFDMFKTTLETLSLHNAFPGEYTSTGARSMLDVFHKVLRDFAEREDSNVGTSLIPYDVMYDGLKDLLKENFKRSIDLAENNIVDNPFAIRVLKALLLVKYLQREFKPTAHNLSVLLLTSFNDNPAELVEKTEEALNRLTKETYIQRNGDQYDFLTNEEKDVEEEIKQTYVPPKDLTDEVKAIIYDNILSGVTKAQDERNLTSYQFTRKIDGETVVSRNAEISINILTPFSGSDSHPQYSDTLTSPDTELVMLLKPDKRLADDLLLYLKTKQYVKNNAGMTVSEDREKVLKAKGERNTTRREEIENAVRDMMSEAVFYVSGTALDVTSSSRIDARVERAFQILIEKVYPNLKMITKESSGEMNARGLIDKSVDSELFKETASEAEIQILNQLRIDKERITTTISSLLDKFRKKPYGWPETALIYNLILLMRKSLINIKKDGKVVDSPAALKGFLFLSSQYGQTVIELCQDIDPKRIKVLKNFIYEFTNMKCPYDDAKNTAKMASDEIRKVYDAVRDKAYSLRYPFTETIKDKLKLLQNAVGQDYLWFFSDEFGDISDDILDAKEDYFDKFLTFTSRKENIEKYEEAERLIRRNESIRDQLDTESWNKIIAILNDKNLYSNSSLSELDKHVSALKLSISQLVTKAKNDALDDFEKYAESVQKETAYRLLGDDQKSHINGLVSAAKTKIAAISSLDELNNTNTFTIKDTKRTITALLEEGKEKAQEKKIIRLSAIQASHVTAPIKTADDVTAFIEKLKKEMMDRINEGYTVE